MSPNALIGIEFWCVGREELQMQAWKARAKFAQRPPAMYLSIVQKNDHVPAQVTEEIAKETTDLVAADVNRVKVATQPKTSPLGEARNRRDGGVGYGSGAGGIQ